ncbi:MAG: SurA N-terminal domain-containing protein [Proteobacteria bacterium]|nr:SurA N-terminal domain-containing protein [Pseudomonadota bacterium]
MSSFVRTFGGFIFFILITVMWTLPLPAEVFNRVVAVVNDEVITLHELNKRIGEMTGYAPEQLKLSDEQRYIETRRKVLELLIDERIAQEKIKELGIRVNEKQIEATIEKVKRDNQWTQEDLIVALKREGFTLEKYREIIKKDLERDRLLDGEVKSKIIIREEMIARYYEEHKQDFASAKKFHFAGIFLMARDLKDQEEMRLLHKKGQEVLERLRAGEDFGELARRFSQGPGVAEGGDLGVFSAEELDPELRKIVESIPEGGFSDLIERPNGIQIVRVIRRDGGEIKPLDDLRNAIHGILYRQEVNMRYNVWIKDLRDRSYTRIIF